jgi:4-hydroxybenzoate polyprenyltransferase
MSSAEDASQQGRVVDAAPDNWVDRFAPALMRPYLRIARADRPIGGWLLALPGLQGLALAGGAVRWDFEQLAIDDWPSAVWLFAAFFVGAFIMRGAGCVLNDIVDRDIDAKVDRTRSRPLPSGQVSLGGAFLVLVVLCLLGLAILFTLHSYAIIVGLAAAVPVIVYPFMKRITWWPQAFLGVAFSWGALVASAAMLGTISLEHALLYASAIAWTIGYDTIYAHQDREDDALIGLRSTARLFGYNSRRALRIINAIAFILAGLAGGVAGLGWFFWVGWACYGLHLFGQIQRLDIDHPALCLHLFKSNREAGVLLLAAILFAGF